MRVLIVEDTQAKAREIAAVLERAGVASESIQIVPDSAQAKRALETTDFAAVILDLRVPSRYDRAPDVDGGKAIVEWIEHGGAKSEPCAIIAISAFELDNAALRELLGMGVVFVGYEQGNTTWSEFLDCFFHRLLASTVGREQSHRNDVDMNGASAPVVILTAVEIELQQAKRVFACQDKPEIRGQIPWYHGVWKGSEVNVPVVVACAAQMGMTAAAVLTVTGIVAWRPRLLAMAGICAGIESQVALGDVVIADPAWDYGSGKLLESGVLEADPRQVPLTTTIRGLVDSLCQREDVLAAWVKAWQGGRPQGGFRLVRRPAASGASVVEDSRVSGTVRDQGRKAAALDMETYGVYFAAHTFPEHPIDFLSVKAVVDRADSSKSDNIQAFGAYLSCGAVGLVIDAWQARRP